MARIVSRHATKIAYELNGKRDPAGLPLADYQRVEIAPGENPVPDVVVDSLMKPHDGPSGPVESELARHAREGFVEILPDEEFSDPLPEIVDPRAKMKGETKAAYAARMAELDKSVLTPDETKFLADFKAMTPEEQGSMYAQLGEREKAIVDADKAGA